MNMEKMDIEKLRALPIEGVAERLGMEIRKHTTLCPFHDDHAPSLRLSVAKNTFKCFVCDAHGGVIDLAMRVLNKPFVETCQWLADEHNIILANESSRLNAQSSKQVVRQFDPTKYLRFFEHPVLSETARRFLYEERHLDPQVVSWCRLNSYTDRKGIPWLQIPYYDMNGRLIGVQSRNLDYMKPETWKPGTLKPGTLKPETSAPRFRFPYGSRCPIYNLPVLRLLQPGEPLYITEGASDCWAMLSAGHKAIAIPSATLLTQKNMKLLEPLKQLGTPLHMYPDQDVPGEKLYLQLVGVANELGASLRRHSLPQGCKDFADYYRKNINLLTH